MAWLSGIFGSIIRFIYDLCGKNYGLSIIIFTILTKLVMFPLTYKQTKSMKDIEKIKPMDAAIRKKYKSNPQKMNEELNKLYVENKVSPAGGCLPLLIQFPIIIAMFYIVKQPLTYIIQTPSEDITRYAHEIYASELANAGTAQEEIDKKIASMNKQQIESYEIQIANEKNLIDMNFLGMNLGDVPSKNMSTKPFLLLIPIITLALSIYQMNHSMKSSSMTDEQKQMQKTTMWLMPVMSAYISLIMPAAMGLYWLLGSVIQLIQQIILDKMFHIKYETKEQVVVTLDKGVTDNEKRN